MESIISRERRRQAAIAKRKADQEAQAKAAEDAKLRAYKQSKVYEPPEHLLRARAEKGKGQLMSLGALGVAYVPDVRLERLANASASELTQVSQHDANLQKLDDAEHRRERKVQRARQMALLDGQMELQHAQERAELAAKQQEERDMDAFLDQVARERYEEHQEHIRRRDALNAEQERIKAETYDRHEKEREEKRFHEWCEAEEAKAVLAAEVKAKQEKFLALRYQMQKDQKESEIRLRQKAEAEEARRRDDMRRNEENMRVLQEREEARLRGLAERQARLDALMKRGGVDHLRQALTARIASEEAYTKRARAEHEAMLEADAAARKEAERTRTREQLRTLDEQVAYQQRQKEEAERAKREEGERMAAMLAALKLEEEERKRRVKEEQARDTAGRKEEMLTEKMKRFREMTGEVDGRERDFHKAVIRGEQRPFNAQQVGAW